MLVLGLGLGFRIGNLIGGAVAVPHFYDVIRIVPCARKTPVSHRTGTMILYASINESFNVDCCIQLQFTGRLLQFSVIATNTLYLP